MARKFAKDFGPLCAAWVPPLHTPTGSLTTLYLIAKGSKSSDYVPALIKTWMSIAAVECDINTFGKGGQWYN